VVAARPAILWDGPIVNIFFCGGIKTEGQVAVDGSHRNGLSSVGRESPRLSLPHLTWVTSPRAKKHSRRRLRGPGVI